MTIHKQPLWSRSVAAALAMSMGLDVAGCRTADPGIMLAEARELRDKGDLRAAIAQLRQLLDNEDNFHAHVLLGEMLGEQADLAGASGEFRAALALGAGVAQALLPLLRSLLMRGEHEQLLAEVLPATTAAHRAAALALRGQAVLALYNLGDASFHFQEALRLETESPDALLGLARLALFQRQADAARDYLGRALASSPSDLDCLRCHADMLWADGKLDDALSVHTAILLRHPCNAPALIDLAQLHTEAGRFIHAHAHLTHARKLAGTTPALMFGEALWHYRQHNAAQAEELAHRILRTAPDHSPSTLLAGVLLVAAGAHQQAEQHLQKFLRQHPGHPGAIRLMATLQLAAGQSQAALALLAPLLAGESADPAVLALAGTANLQARDFTSAAAQFGSIRADTPVRPLWHDLALSRIGTGDYCRQIAILERMIASADPPFARDYVRALAHMRSGDEARAFDAVATLESFDDNPLVHELKGQIYLARHDLRNARQCFNNALGHDPAYLPALDQLRHLDAQERRPPETTRNRYLAALSASPGNGAVMQALSTLALSHHHPAEAISWMQRASAGQPASLPLALCTGKLYLQLKAPAQALALARQLEAAAPADPEVLCLLGEASLASGEYAGAAQVFARLAAMLPHSGLPHLRLASVHIAQQQDAAALSALKQALAVEPDLLEARAALVELFIRHQRFTEALAIAVAAQNRPPHQAEGYRLEGAVHASRRRFVAASAAYARAFALAPSGSIAVELHDSLVKQGSEQEAAAMLRQWLAEHPADIAARTHLAQCRLAAGDLPGAATELALVLEHAPDNLDALNDLAWVGQRMGDPAALALAQRALALAPDNPAVLDTLGWIHLEQGEFTRALPLLQKASTLAPQEGEIHLHLGSVLAQTGDTAGARRALEKALASTAPFSGRADAQAMLAAL